MAGFGARRLAESSRRKADVEARRMREWQRQENERLAWEQQEADRIAWEQYEADRRAHLQWEEERRAQVEHDEREWRRQQQQHAEEEEHQRRQAQWYEQQRAEHQRRLEQEEHERRSRSRIHTRGESSHSAYADMPSGGGESSDRAAERWYHHLNDRPISSSADTGRQWSSDTDGVPAMSYGESYSRDSGRNVAAQSHGRSSYSQESSDAVFKGHRLAAPSVSTMGGSLGNIRSSLVDRRATIYEDEYEEEDGDEHIDITANLSRYTHYGGPSDADADQSGDSGNAAWSGARKSLFRNTTYQPIPKARCADCLEEFDFDELADHACDQASTPATPITPLPPLKSPASDVTTPNSDVSPSSSSFFHKYAAYEETRSKTATPTPPTAVVTAVGSGMVRSTSDDVTTTKTSGLGLGVTGMPTRSNSSPTASPSRHHKALQDEMIMERRRRIEAQREAKRMAGGSSPSPSFADSPPKELTKLLEAKSSPSPTKERHQVKQQPQPTTYRHHPTPSRNASSSSAGSYSSNASAASSAFQGPVSVSITPSSSFSQQSDQGRHESSPPSKGFLSPETASGAFPWGRKAGATHHRSSSAAAVEAARKARLEQLATAAAKDAALSKSPRLARKEVDLGGIEDLMETLQVSRDDEKPRRRANRPPQLDLTPSTTPKEHMDRQRKKAERKARRCRVCNCSLSSSTRTAFVEKDGQYICRADYAALYLPKCTKCHQPVERDAVKSSDGALRGIFHRGCFSCFECNELFKQGVFYVWENQPYCLDHYSSRAGTGCASCHKGIEGTCRQVMAGKSEGEKELYHPECLRCQMDDCREVLQDFYVVGGKRLCEKHAELVQRIVDQEVAAKVGSASSQRKAKKTKKAEKRTTMLRALT